VLNEPAIKATTSAIAWPRAWWGAGLGGLWMEGRLQRLFGHCLNLRPWL